MLDARCEHQVRAAATPAERAVEQKGWKLYGPSQTWGITTVFTAMSDVDGMCRPLGYQAFVYTENRYAGTLSPAAMNSREDGALTRIHLTSATQITGEFARYTPSDPLCCPSKIMLVQYTIRNDEIPTLEASMPTAGANAMSEAGGLSGRRWLLVEAAGQMTWKGGGERPYLEFNDSQHRVSGNTGCNRVSGEYTADAATLRFGSLVSTRRACVADEANRLEAAFLSALERTTRFAISGGTLRLYQDGTLVLTLESK
jgi:heat shock protein HslJ